MKHICNILICLMTAINVCGQVPHFYTMQQGLRSSYISTLYVDAENFLWVSTNTSLEVFDGHRFQEIVYRDKGGALLFNKVNSIKQIDSSRYWIMTNLGLFIYDKSSNIFSKEILTGDEDNTSNRSSIQHGLNYPGGKQTLFSSEGHGFFLIDNKSLRNDTKTAEKLNNLVGASFTRDVVIDSRGNLWVSDIHNHITCIQLKSLKKQPLQISPTAQSIMEDCYVMNFIEDKTHSKLFMAMSHNGVLVYDYATKEIRELRGNDRELYCTSMIMTKAGDMFLGSDNKGLQVVDTEQETIKPFDKNIEEVDIHHVKVHALAEDKDGNLIAGIYQNGILMIPRQNSSFNYMPLSAYGNGKNTSCVTSFCEDTQGTLWIRTDGAGVFHDGRCINDGFNSDLIQTLLCDKSGTIWSGSWHGGFACCKGGDKFFTPAFLQAYSHVNVMDMVYDKGNDIIYAGTSGEGVLKIDLIKEEVSALNGSEVFQWVNKIYLDRNGILWIGDATTLFRYQPSTNKYKEVRLASSDIVIVNDFAEENNTLYLATTRGLICYDTSKQQIVDRPFMKELKGVSDIKNIQLSKHHLWLSDSRHILCVDKESGKLVEYDSFNGHYIGEFHLGSSICSGDETLYFGGDNGMLSFNSHQLLHMAHDIKQVYLSPIWIGDKLSGSNSYHLTFSVPELAMSERINYKYMLKGYEKEWHVAQSDAPEAYYASLPPGNYDFIVRAFYSDTPEKFTEQHIKVSVPSPWYATWWAYLLYTLIAGTIGYILYQNIKERQQSRRMLREAEQNEQIKEDKLRLFTSIAHELRSPLTMIMSPLRQLIITDRSLDRQGNYSIMQRNCSRIERIVNQMLDVRKIDNGQFHLHFTESELNTYTKEVMESFKGIAAAKAIQFTHESTEESIPVWIDAIHFEKVLFNLLSNAFKYTPSDGRVIVRSSCQLNSQDNQSTRVLDDYRIIEFAEIRIYNSGSHISENDLKHLWERFYQGDKSDGKEGSGIGLNLAYELVKLHHGTIEARNVGEDGVEFVVRIPMGKVHLNEDELKAREEKKEEKEEGVKEEMVEVRTDYTDMPESEAEPINTLEQEDAEETEAQISGKEEIAEKQPEKNLILVVDDDKELCAYMSDALRAEYQVITAHSGNEAWDKILAHRPTIVVSDLMMPDGDGYDLCRRIKSNPETDSIAVIMLTSESNEDSQLRSMNLQADHFLPKPFNLALLNSAISQVLRVRENIRNKMRRTEIGNNYGNIEFNSYEDKFVIRLKELVMKRISDPQFNVNELSREIGMSRVHLNRKLKEYFGISPNAYIRSIRLKQAAYLLVNHKVNISEVAFHVGFSSHSYFSSIFHEFFGMSPKEFVATYSDNINDETLQKLLE